MKDIIGFWGYPDKNLINKYKKEYNFATWVDLDIDYGNKKSNTYPDAYCVIIKNIIDNAYSLKDRLIAILAPIGKDKCDSAFFVAKMLEKDGFNIVFSVFEDKCPDINNVKLPISRSALPLKEKVDLITKNIIKQKDYSNLAETKAKFGFWGVPPNDLTILDIFPEQTHVYGWLRAVEAGYPGDFELEGYVDSEIPTVFFTQAFCSKTILAKHLANKYNGLYIDIDAIPTNSAKAKIEAFLRLR